MTHRTRFVISILTLAAAAVAQEYFPPPDSVGGWRTLKGQAEIRKTSGMDLQKLDWAFDYASRSSQHGGLLVARLATASPSCVSGTNFPLTLRKKRFGFASFWRNVPM